MVFIYGTMIVVCLSEIGEEMIARLYALITQIESEEPSIGTECEIDTIEGSGMISGMDHNGIFWYIFLGTTESTLLLESFVFI
jgi:hypothetical protein